MANMTIQLGHFDGDTGVVHKNWHVVHNNVTVILKEDTSVTHPNFIFEMDINDLVNVNGIYWPKEGRYYTTQEPVLMPGNRISLQCDVDVLKSFSDDIDNMTALIVRNEKMVNNELIDDCLLLNNKKKITTKTIGNLPWSNGLDVRSILLMTSGGGASGSNKED